MVDHTGALNHVKRVLKQGARAYLSVSKVLRRKDPRAVGEEEWEKMLKQFLVLERGNGLTNRWAVVSIMPQVTS